jgi:hypothetical protein
MQVRHFASRLSSMTSAAALVVITGFSSPAVAADTPPSPLTKSGYTLDFSEEFDASTLNSSRWLDYYLPHWTSNREAAKARYSIANGVLTERLDQDTPAWNPAYDSTVKISSIQTYNADWWHRFNSSMPNDHHEPTFNGYSTKYGYFEMRAKNSNVGGGGHQAWWMVGTEDTSSASRNPEIDIVETFFSKPQNWRIAGYGWGDANFLGSWYLSDQAVPTGSPTSEYHLYGMEWTPTELKFYYDNQLYRTISDAPNMPMGMILGLYTDAGSGQHNDVWPKTWNVDYIRVWKKDGGYPESSYQRIKNRQTGKVIHIEGLTGSAQAGTIASTAWSSQWQRETTTDGYVRYRNRWTGDYLHTENLTGNVQYGAAPAGWWSSQWTEEPVSGYTRFRNRQSSAYMHTEADNGSVQYGSVPSTWWSSQWSFEPAS